jgi:integrase
MAGGRASTRERGSVRQRGNSFEIKVYSGVDPVTGKDVYLYGNTKDEREVEKIRTALLAQVDKQRSASTRATLAYTIAEWLDTHEGDESTLDTYRGYVSRTINPALGELPLPDVSARRLEKFYARLRKCSKLCDGKAMVDHRTSRPHECKQIRHRRKPGRPSAKSIAEHDCTVAGCTVIDCKPHVCTPMASSSIRQIHAIISGSLDMAMRWEWITSNPASVTKKPKQDPPQPKPPTAKEAARLVEGAFEEDFAWGVLVWLFMVAGPRRGELLALTFAGIDFDEETADEADREGTIELSLNYVQRGGKKRLKSTKNHQTRRIALDADSLALVAILWQEYNERMAQLRATPSRAAFVFSYTADNSGPANPDGITHRFARLCKRLGIDSHLHALRHYSATELISAGVDVRTVAGRLGHGGGGTTTLRVYAAFVPESDKRAAKLLAGRMPRPGRRAAN